MEQYLFNIVTDDGKPVSAMVVINGRVYTVTPGHINFHRIIGRLRQAQSGYDGFDTQEMLDLLDVGHSIARRFRAAARRVKGALGADVEVAQAAERIEVRDGGIFWEGERVHGVLADTVLAYYRLRDENFSPLVRFMAKIMENPNEHSRQFLYEWMQHLSFNIAEDGDLLAYKGVYANSEGGYRSTSRGYGEVNGRVYEYDTLPQDVGDRVSMPREKVAFDPSEACSTGLHVGTQQYARSYGDTLIEVKIHPKDVVSVPSDHDAQKMRVCAYEVVRVVSTHPRYDDALDPDLSLVGADDYDEDDEDYDY